MTLKNAYLILAHNNPRQLSRLLTRLNCPENWFFLHIDRRVPITDFLSLLENPAFKIIPVERENARWGAFGIAKATLNALRQICDHAVKFDYIHLISGADYPIVSNKAINDFFASQRCKIYIEHFPMPAKVWPQGGMRRLQWYNFIRMQHYSRWKWYTLLIVNKCINAIPWFRRRFPPYLTPFGGSQWWSITLPAAQYIQWFVSDHPDYLQFHRHTLAPDECFFQTILLNAQDPAIKENIINDNLRYIVWSKPGVTKFPLLLTIDELENITASGKLWARKFDLSIDGAIFDALDRFAEVR